jgi:hypothetical protein
MVHKRHRKRMRKRKNILAGFKRANALQTFKCKILGWTTIVNGAGVTASYANSYSLNYPSYYTNSAATFAQLPNFSTTYTRAFQFFNEYKVKRLIVRFEPNVVDTAIVNTDIPNSCYMERDYTDGSLLTDTTAMELGRPPMPYSSGHTLKLSLINKSNAAKLWFLTIAAPLPLAAPNNNMATVVPDSYGSIKLFFGGIGTLINIGRVYCEWDVEFRGIKV